MKDLSDDINLIHYNDFGIAFNWKHNNFSSRNKIQLVFKETGLLLSNSEIFIFKSTIENAICTSCNCANKCKNFVQSPSQNINFSMTDSELSGLNDLLSVVCFSIELNNILQNII